MQSVSIIGIGRLGGALAIALSRAGFAIENLVHRDPSTAISISAQLSPTAKLVSWSELPDSFRSDVLLIATPDPEIGVVADGLMGRIKPGAVVLHTSGSLSSKALSALACEGISTGSMHPLVAVSNAASGADNFKNGYFCVEGDDVATAVARSIVEALDGHPFSIDAESKGLYHAAAVVASGHVVALLDVALEMLLKSGVTEESARRILFPLISTTVANVLANSPGQALTGSFARADVDAVRRHLSSIEEAGISQAARNVYLLLGERSLDLAAGNGADPARVRILREIISIAKRKTG